QYEQVYRQLLDESRAQNPHLLMVIGEPFTLPYGGTEGDTNPRVADVKKRQEIARRLARDYNAVFVPFQQVFNDALKRAPEKYWIWDHVHPTVAGHELMAREWLKQVSSRLKFLKKEY
ncbi:GDSL-type esterase/lipase family protein, partial [Chitinophaga sp.]|uniref:GDSL-type esterase/lipase family protein n=1 Tax=Chitinophaga sp. TaxID=1869181 RepID=UPI002F9206E8